MLSENTFLPLISLGKNLFHIANLQKKTVGTDVVLI